MTAAIVGHDRQTPSKGLAAARAGGRTRGQLPAGSMNKILCISASFSAGILATRRS